MKRIISVVFVVFGFFACSLSADDTAPNCGTLNNIVYEEFSYCGTLKQNLKEPSFIVLSSEEDVKKNFTTCDTFAPADFPDFTKKRILVLFAGVKPTGGYTIEIKSIKEDDCQITVDYFETEPKAEDSVPQVISYPADYVVIPKTNKPIFFKKVNQFDKTICVF